MPAAMASVLSSASPPPGPRAVWITLAVRSMMTAGPPQASDSSASVPGAPRTAVARVILVWTRVAVRTDSYC